MKLESKSIIQQKHINLLREVTTQKLDKTLKRLTLPFCVIGILLLLWQLIEIDYFYMVSGAFVLAVGITIVPLSHFVNKKASAKLNQTILIDDTKNIITYESDHALVLSYINGEKIGEHKLYYNKVVRANFYQGGLLLFISQNQAYTILSEDMTEGTFGDLIPLLKTALGNKLDISNA